MALTFKDFKIAEWIEREGKGCLLVVNKWDTVPNKNQQTTAYYEEDVRGKLRILNWAPIVYSTAIQGHSVEKYGSNQKSLCKSKIIKFMLVSLNSLSCLPKIQSLVLIDSSKSFQYFDPYIATEIIFLLYLVTKEC